MTHHDTFLLLRSLDPAEQEVAPRSERALRDLDRILSADGVDTAMPSATPHDATPHDGTPPTSRPRPRRPRLRRVLLAAAAVVVTAAGLVAAPRALGGDPAFATWTAEPSGLSPAEAAHAAEACRDSRAVDGGTTADQVSRATPVVSERRGAWTTVVLAGDAGFSALCITDSSAPLFGGNIGSVGTPSTYRAPGAREVTATDLGAGTVGGGHWLSLAAGYAGPDVVRVTVPTRDHGPVEATVSGGHFAAWWPGAELEDVSRTGGLAVVLTYADGSTGTATLRL